MAEDTMSSLGPGRWFQLTEDNMKRNPEYAHVYLCTTDHPNLILRYDLNNNRILTAEAWREIYLAEFCVEVTDPRGLWVDEGF